MAYQAFIWKSIQKGGTSYGMDDHRFCCDSDHSLRHRSDHRNAGSCLRSERKDMLSFLTTAIAASVPLSQFAEGATLAASIYFISRGINEKK